MVQPTRKQRGHLGSPDEGSQGIVGGISPVFSQRDDRGDRGEDDGKSIEIPKQYRTQAIIYPVVKNKILPFQGLADGSIDAETFVKAQKMAEFYHFVDGELDTRNKKQDDVEYFD